MSSLAFHTFAPLQLVWQIAIFLNLFLPGSSPTINLDLFAYFRLTMLWKSQLLYFNILGSWVNEENLVQAHLEKKAEVNIQFM